MNFVQSNPECHIYFSYIQKAPESFTKDLGENIYIYVYINPNKTMYVSERKKQKSF